MSVSVRWDLAERGLGGWAGSRLAAVLPRPRRRKAAEEVDVFLTTFDAPMKAGEDMRKAASLALPQLMPADPGGLIIFGRMRTGSAELAAVRKSDIETPEYKASSITLAPDWIVPTPAAETESRRRFAFAAAGAFATIVALVWIQLQSINAFEQATSTLVSEGEGIRAAARLAAERRNETDIWSSLASQQLEDRAPANVLALLGALTRATPDTASWTRLTLGPAQILIEGAARDPVALLAALSKLDGMTAQFSKPVLPQGDGRQQFEIRLERKGTKPP